MYLIKSLLRIILINLIIIMISNQLQHVQLSFSNNNDHNDFKLIYPKNLINNRYHNDSLCNDDSLIIHLDYSLTWNSYMAVCQNNLIDIEPIDYNHSTKLNILQFPIKKLEHFTFDWLHGLLYYSTVMDGINVVDLKKTELSTFPIYRAPGTNIVNGLIVHPTMTKLQWLETSGTDTIMMESDQNGKRAKSLFIINRTTYHELYYDQHGKQHLLIMPQTQASRISGLIVKDYDDNSVKNSIKFEINFSKQNWDVQNIRVRNDWIYFLLKQSETIAQIYRCSLSSLSSSSSTISPLKNESSSASSRRISNDNQSTILITDIHSTSCVLVTTDNGRSPFLFYDPSIRAEFDQQKHCSDNVCLRQDYDFCIPINQTHSQCTNGEIFIIDNETNEMLIYKIIISILISIILIILIIYFLFFSKQRSSFYQIRLKKLKRVESSKLQVKPPATNEIAD